MSPSAEKTFSLNMSTSPAPAAVDPSAAPRPRLLIVDDQPINIRVLHMILAQHYQVLMATSGAQALKVCEEQQPALVLMDVVMPDMDGYEACRQLRAHPATRHVPVVFVTAHDDPVERQRGLDAGAVDFVSKPVSPVEVQAVVARHLHRT